VASAYRSRMKGQFAALNEDRRVVGEVYGNMESFTGARRSMEMGLNGKERVHPVKRGVWKACAVRGRCRFATWVVACWVWIDVYLLYNTLGVAMDLVSHHHVQCA